MAGYRVLFVTKNHLPHVGGTEVSTDHLAAALGRRGHDVTVVTRLTRRSMQGLIDSGIGIVGRGARIHWGSALGYPTARCIRPLESVRSVIGSIAPDVVVVTATDPAFACEALELCHDLPTVLYARVEASVPVAVGGAHFDLAVSNSDFIARSMNELGVEATFLPSLFPRDVYRVSTTREKVLFVNPIPKKGSGVALDLARRRPDIRFVFSLSWRMQRAALRRLRREVRGLENVEIRRATRSPAELFRDARVLLVPTQQTEAWGRVVSEAQINAIPVVASRVGGLPEAVGPGGIVVDPPDSRTAWLHALTAVWDDQVRYQRLSDLARSHSQRPEMSVESVVRRFEAMLGQAIDRHSGCREAVVDR